MKRGIAGFVFVAVLFSAAALAQQPKAGPGAIEKPKAPAKPIAPSARPLATKAAPTDNAPFVSQLQGLSPEVRAFASAKLSAMTPALRVQAASRLTKRTVALDDMPQSWLASAGNPSGTKLWLGAENAGLAAGPDIEPMFLVSGGSGPERGIWVQFDGAAGVQHMLVCDMTGPERWDLVIDSVSRVSLKADGPTRGVALIPARPASSFQRVLLVVARAQQTGPGSSLAEGLRRCEITPIHG
jgi:hypothetical protein